MFAAFLHVVGLCRVETTGRDRSEPSDSGAFLDETSSDFKEVWSLSQPSMNGAGV
jgi:hypothetical protein